LKLGTNIGSVEIANIFFNTSLAYPESEFYKKAVESGDLQLLNAYLRQYPNGKHASEVQAQIDNAYWKNCTSIEGCQTYLNAAKNKSWAKHIAEAKEKILRLSCESGDALACQDLFLRGKLDLQQYAVAIKKSLKKIEAEYNRGFNLAKQIPTDQKVYSVAFDPHGKQLAASTNNNSIIIYDTNDWREIHKLKLNDYANSVSYSPEGDVLAAGLADGTVRIFSTDNWNEIKQIRFSGWIWPVAFSPNGYYLASGGQSGMVKVFSTISWLEASTIGTGNPIYALAYSPDGKKLAVACKDGSVIIFSTSNWLPIKQLHFGDWIGALAFSPDGRYLALGGKGKRVQILDTSSWEEIANSPIDGWTVAATFSHNGEYLAVGTSSGVTKIISTQKYWPVADNLKSNPVLSLAFSPDDNLLALGTKSSSPPSFLYIFNAPPHVGGFKAYIPSKPTKAAQLDNLLFTPIAVLDSKSRGGGFYLMAITTKENGGNNQAKKPIRLELYDQNNVMLATSQQYFEVSPKTKGLQEPGYVAFKLDEETIAKLRGATHSFRIVASTTQDKSDIGGPLRVGVELDVP